MFKMNIWRGLQYPHTTWGGKHFMLPLLHCLPPRHWLNVLRPFSDATNETSHWEWVILILHDMTRCGAAGLSALDEGCLKGRISSAHYHSNPADTKLLTTQSFPTTHSPEISLSTSKLKSLRQKLTSASLHQPASLPGWTPSPQSRAAPPRSCASLMQP